MFGHPPGEIGAAYVAGIISAEEAIRVAYYRAVHAKPARGNNGKPRAMMAVGLSFDEASDFCEQNFSDPIDVAASNAPASVTLSRDKDAIQEAQAIFQEQGTFARLLQVATAYHSAHIMPSVSGDRMEGDMVDAPRGEYWKDSMVNPVLFSMAVKVSANGELPCDVVLEIGPHPALKAPFTETEALGFLWARLGTSGTNLSTFSKAFNPDSSSQLAALPAYPWDHSQSFWKKSRNSRNFYSKPASRHALLGDRSTDDIDQSMIIYSAAGYLVMALESSNSLTLGAGREVELIELYDVEI
ncbi:hypothetical protein J3F83DRAFT_769295 [Trichoderma novae-zelandiae]